MELKGSKTEANLWKAFAGESMARNKYTYFASKAKKEGYEQIAAIFEETAANEKEHAKLWFKELSGIGDTAANLKAAYPGLIVCGTHDGYFKEDAPVVEAIRQSAADVVFVCLGAPKQEFWMAKNGPASGARLMVGLGGSLDVFAGVVDRAPKGFQKLGLEWLYRLMKEPRRIGRMAKLPLVLIYALGDRLGGKRHENR